MYYNGPLISVIMGVCCSREGVSALEQAVRSILIQTITDFEFLICENASDSEALSVLTTLSEEDARIRLIDGRGADTLPKKLNRCLCQARGKWIARMDDDDISYPCRFEKQLHFLQKSPDCAVVGCCVREINGTIESVRNLPQWPSIQDFQVTLPFVHSALMLRRTAIEAAGGYSEHPRQVGCDDYDLVLRIYALGYRGANIQEVLLDYSVISSQLCRRPYRLFLNEYFTRMERFKVLGLLPRWLPWAIKPLLVGLLPRSFLYWIKHRSHKD